MAHRGVGGHGDSALGGGRRGSLFTRLMLLGFTVAGCLVVYLLYCLIVYSTVTP